MSEIYDNWDRLVRATLRREQLRISAQRTPSDLSVASPSSVFTSPAPHVSSFNFSGKLVGKSFTYNQILQATNHLNISNLIAHGRSGDFFYGVLEGGLQVVVKRIYLPSSIKKESYLLSELEFFGKVSHSRFVPFLGHCLDNWTEKFLVYKYMPNRDLSSSLYYRVRVSDDNVDCPSTTLDWVTRLKIATGVAQGLCYLHHECVPPLVHRNIGASSILIDENYEARLGRVIKVCTEEKDRNQNRISRFLRLPKGSERDTSGALNAMCAYDVYCFGKVLLELVTGNSGFSDYSGSNLKDLIENTLRCITIDNKDLFVSIMDPSLEVNDDVFIKVWAIAVVAKACLSPKPSKRPKMIYILEALENPTLVRLSTYGGPLHAGQPGRMGSVPAEKRISKGSTPGAMADAKFQFKIHYGGQFLMFGANNSYIGGKVSYAESMDPDHMSLIKLMGIVEDLGISTAVNLYHLLPDADMDGGLRILVGDNDVLDMLAINAGREIINLYVEHFFMIDRNHGAEPAEANNAGTSQATGNGTSSGSSTALWSHQFSAASESYMDGVIQNLPELRIYSFSELKDATRNFRSDCVVGEGRSGTVYKGWQHEKSGTKNFSGSPIAVKRLKLESIPVLQEWKAEIAMIGRLFHPNLVKLLGYCNEEKNPLLVYEFMEMGSLANHLFQRASFVGSIPWDIRLKILIGAARGLAFLHSSERQAIYRDFKASSILLDADYNAKLSYFGFAKMNTAADYGYAAPEYIARGQLYVKSNVYGFGVVLAEVLTGLRSLDNNRPVEHRNLIDWIKPLLCDKRKVRSIMDPQLEGKYPLKAAAEMAKLCHTCLASECKARPSMKEVVDALERIQSPRQL